MLIYLNGASSSGKSTLALELQKLILKPVVYFSIDNILYSLAPEDLDAIMGMRTYRHPINWDSIFSGYLSCVASLVNTGNVVIGDCPIHNDTLASFFDQFVLPLDRKFLVGIDCSLPTLESREVQRGDRAIGVARRQFDGIHKFIRYDAKIETDKWSARDLAHQVYSKLSLSIYA